MFVTFKTIDGHTIQTDDYPNIARFEVEDKRRKSMGKSPKYWKTYTCYIPFYNWLTIYIVDRNIKANQ